VQHGGSSRVEITAELRARHVLLQIHDNGSGIDDGGREAGLSTLARSPASLQHRIAELNGTISLASAASGTTLHIRLPLSGAA